MLGNVERYVLTPVSSFFSTKADSSPGAQFMRLAGLFEPFLNHMCCTSRNCNVHVWGCLQFGAVMACRGFQGSTFKVQLHPDGGAFQSMVVPFKLIVRYVGSSISSAWNQSI
jgi:hypothetical protein